MLTEEERDRLVDELCLTYLRSTPPVEIINLLAPYTEIDMCRDCISRNSCRDPEIGSKRCPQYGRDPIEVMNKLTDEVNGML